MQVNDKLWIVCCGHDAMGDRDIFLRYVTVVSVDGDGVMTVELSNGRRMDVAHDDPDAFVDKVEALKQAARRVHEFREKGERARFRSKVHAT